MRRIVVTLWVIHLTLIQLDEATNANDTSRKARIDGGAKIIAGIFAKADADARTMAVAA